MCLIHKWKLWPGFRRVRAMQYCEKCGKVQKAGPSFHTPWVSAKLGDLEDCRDKLVREIRRQYRANILHEENPAQYMHRIQDKKEYIERMNQWLKGVSKVLGIEGGKRGIELEPYFIWVKHRMMEEE